ncbi:hypothetical protein DID88_007990 [Monilinia fructigena]|uniref:FAD-binding PCMH-type domain-containing protein n=1 Tax=Monilinia fructigena TaxID=38457 RepID=A0A395J3W0_9HELO|nr:hypothetical protein DID88_007990 [Monilinia fructigena]
MSFFLGHLSGGFTATASAIPELQAKSRKERGLYGVSFSQKDGSPPVVPPYCKFHKHGFHGVASAVEGAKYFFNGLDEAQAKHYESTLTASPVFQTFLHNDAYSALPSTYLVTEDDLALPAAYQEGMVALQNLRPEVNIGIVKCLSGHSPHLTWIEGCRVINAASLPRRTQPEAPGYENQAICCCLPGYDCWPAPEVWAHFNQSLGGKLIATKPLASSCHLDPFETYNEENCAIIQAKWSLAETHLKTSSSIMSPFFANYSCDPFSPRASQCIIGTYVQYAVDASGASDYKKTIEFAIKHNIRLTIRNTGHDYYGKATGAGAIAIWTQHLKSIEILTYKSNYYTGKAIKVGLVIVGGNDGTVGLAGGYTQGGGHGQLVSRYGLAADQVLEWKVVTANGDLIVASPVKNQDLYWALSGGGGGTYGVVLSMTSRAHPDEQTAAANLTSLTLSVWLMTNSSFAMTPASGIGLTSSVLNEIMRPTIMKLEENHVNYTYFVGDFPTFLDAFKAMNPPNPVNNIQIGGRFIPRSLVESSNGSQNLMNAVRDISNKVGAISGIALNASQKEGHIANSAHPQWRQVLFDAVVGTYWSNNDPELNISNQDLVTYDVVPQIEKLVPGGGAYLSEGDFREPKWQQVFYGDNYESLRSIKQKYDPHGLFYALTAVGSDSWVVSENGSLCKIR